MRTIKTEADRCLKCPKPKCSANCPVSTPIPEVMRLFQHGEFREAGRLLFDNNPLSAITSIICPHERNCAGHCVLGMKGEPVEFYRVEQYLSKLYLETFDVPEVPKNGKRVAVAGGGPAGITMSLALAYRGYDVTLFEAEGNIGGVLMYGIPDFRLTKDMIDLYRDILIKLGVHIRLNTRIGTNITLDDLFLDGYRAVFLGMGTGRPNRLGLLGETLGNVHFAIDYLKSPQEYHLGKKVIVVGAGNVAMDAARTAVRKARANVTILNRMSENEMSASRSEIELAEIDGIQFIHNAQVVRIIDNTVRCVGVDKVENSDGSIEYIEDFGDAFDLEADSVILAIGQGPGAEISYGESIDLTGRGLIEVNEFGETSTPNVFAAGDVVTGPSTVVQAVASTLRTGRYMLERLESM